jgi:hypothetical protein
MSRKGSKADELCILAPICARLSVDVKKISYFNLLDASTGGLARLGMIHLLGYTLFGGPLGSKFWHLGRAEAHRSLRC